MSLSSTLNRTTKAIAPNLLETIESDTDKVLIENILIAAQELLPFINVSSTNIAKLDSIYRVSVSLCAGDICVSLHDLAVLQRNWPARIADIKFKIRGDGVVVCLDVAHEGYPIAVTQLDVVRLSKRVKFC